MLPRVNQKELAKILKKDFPGDFHQKNKKIDPETQNRKFFLRTYKKYFVSYHFQHSYEISKNHKKKYLIRTL